MAGAMNSAWSIQNAFQRALARHPNNPTLTSGYRRRPGRFAEADSLIGVGLFVWRAACPPTSTNSAISQYPNWRAC